ncbi:hypothetical protein [Streptomyces sp. A0958]|nr:hypothetical protein [Streptomyces sp. A0958]
MTAHRPHTDSHGARSATTVPGPEHRTPKNRTPTARTDPSLPAYGTKSTE